MAQPLDTPALPTLDEQPALRLQAHRGWSALHLKELWQYRELLLFLAVRDIKIRYKQTALGAAWVLLQPLMGMLIFSLFFGRLAKMPSDDKPYPLFVLCGLLPWQLFSQALANSSNSLIENERLMTKVYFPRLLIPFSSVLAAIVDFAISLLLLGVFLPVYGVTPGWAILTLPLMILFTLASALAVGLWLSALNAMYRDFRYTVPFLVQVWLFVTPVVYPARLVPEQYRAILGLNPMAGVVEGFRWALLGTEAPGPLIGVSATVVVALFVGGMFFFRRIERTMADWV